MSTDLTYHIRRLQQVSKDCGVAQSESKQIYGSAQDQQLQGPLSATASVFDKGRYNLAVKLRDLSDNIAELQALESGAGTSDETRLLSGKMPVASSSSSSASGATQTQKSIVGVQIRKGIKSCKDDLVALRPLAKAEDRKEDYELLKHHIEKTEQLYKNRFRVAVGGGGADMVEEHIQPRVPDFKDFKEGNDAPLLSLRDDPEFQAHFAQQQDNDQQIDGLVDDIQQGVTRLGVQAKAMNEEVTVQIGILAQSDEKATKVGGDLKQVNKKLRKTIISVDKDKTCCYLLCLLLLIIVAGALVYVTFFDKKESRQHE